MHKEVAILALLLCAWPALAQLSATRGTGPKRVDPRRNVPVLPQMECERLTANAERWVLDYCREVDFSTQSTWARLYGNPRPSRTVLEVPELGTAEARRTGVSCSEGRVIAKVGNVWVQPLDHELNYLRCRPTVRRPGISIGQ